MLIGLLVAAGVVGLGTLGLGALALRGRRHARGAGTAGARRAPGASDAGRGITGERERAAEPRGLRVGDVLLYLDSELWLAGEVHLDEEGFALSLFHTPASTRACWVAQLDAEARAVAFLTETSEVPGGAVPGELPVGGVRLSLSRRGQADVSTRGEQLPPVTDRARYTLLAGPGGRTLVVVDFEGGARLALVGDVVARELYDLLPGGDAG